MDFIVLLIAIAAVFAQHQFYKHKKKFAGDLMAGVCCICAAVALVRLFT